MSIIDHWRRAPGPLRRGMLLLALALFYVVGYRIGLLIEATEPNPRPEVAFIWPVVFFVVAIFLGGAVYTAVLYIRGDL